MASGRRCHVLLTSRARRSTLERALTDLRWSPKNSSRPAEESDSRQRWWVGVPFGVRQLGLGSTNGVCSFCFFVLSLHISYSIP